MNPDGIFSWPDGDVILRTTQGLESHDFRVHKVFLSFSSPVFRDMFGIPQPLLVARDGVDVVDIADPPRALELILRYMYPSATSPTINDLTTLSEAWVLADKYDVEVARSRLRSSLREFATTEPLRAYAVACRFELEVEKKMASSRTTSVHLPGLTTLPDEFRFVPATEYHRLILLHERYRKEVEKFAQLTVHEAALLQRGKQPAWVGVAYEFSRENIVEVIRGGIPLNYESFKLAWRVKYGTETDGTDAQTIFSFALGKAKALNLSV